MPSRRRFLSTAGVVGSAAVAGCTTLPFVGHSRSVALGEDFPEPADAPVTHGWPQFRRDRANTACVPDADPIPEPSVDWTSRPLSIPPRASMRTVTVDGATVYTADGAAQAFDVVSGDHVWSQNATVQARVAPNVVDGLAWVRGGEGASTALALDQSSGDVADRVDLSGVPTYAPSVTPEQGYVAAPTGGQVAATMRNPDDGVGGRPDEWTHDVYGQGSFRVAATRDVYAVSYTGEAYRFTQWGFVGWRTDLDRVPATQPVVGADRVYVGIEEGAVALAQDGGRVVWTFDGADELSRSGIAFDGARVFLVDERAVHALSAKTGERVWVEEFEHDVTTMPVVGGDRVYVGTGSEVHALSVSGDREWTVDVEREVGAGLAVAGGRLYAVADGDGEGESVILSLA
ncbi:PQQ-binding-like beta-propeller repeat protein [Halobacterium wangiae]|uniref:outer membrane protein assembly factor BamB family protein n=1 Tax=Halobacterium wangiae TaxID=2902623 RepID=UPI001E4A76C3|nr:PQQ-binding-like beta-propeller repeat protein [Halobacterium wangiae]